MSLAADQSVVGNRLSFSCIETSVQRSHSARHFRLPRYVLALVLIIALIYFNVAALLSSSRIRIDLPRPAWARRVFEIFSLFSYYQTTNYGFEAVGRVAGSDDHSDGERWIAIDPYPYFPQVLGEANRRLYFFGVRDVERKKYLYIDMLNRIKRLHERDSPDAPVDRIRLYMTSWPMSTQGYWTEYESRTRQLIAEE